MAHGKVLTTNRKAYHDYHIDEAFEAGIALTGTEVKSLREGRANLRDGYGAVEGGGGVSSQLPHQPVHASQPVQP